MTQEPCLVLINTWQTDRRAVEVMSSGPLGGLSSTANRKDVWWHSLLSSFYFINLCAVCVCVFMYEGVCEYVYMYVCARMHVCICVHV